jgi:hypothetical protein
MHKPDRSSLLPFTFALAVVIATGAHAQLPGDLYGSVGRQTADPGAIVTVDQTTGADMLVGDPTGGTVGLPGMDFDSTGRLFAVTADGLDTFSTLLELDPDTGAVLNTVGAVTVGGQALRIADLAFQPGTDVLYGVASSRRVSLIPPVIVSDFQIYTIDTTTAVATLVGDPGVGENGGLAFTPDGTLYLATVGVVTLQLVTLDPATAAVNTTVPLDRGLDGLGARIDGQLFGTASQANTDIVAVATDGTTTTLGAATRNVADLAFRPLLLDHFKCYQARETRGTPRFIPVTVALSDQFESVPASRINRPRNLCNPVDKEFPAGVFSGVPFPDAHLVGYMMRDDRGTIGKFQKRHVMVINQFGAQEIIVKKPLQLEVPASKAIAPGMPGPPPVAPDGPENFRCYKAQPAKGSSTPMGLTVGLADQFGTTTDTITKCFRFCNPVEKDGTPLVNPNGHLTCYRLVGPPPPATQTPNVDVDIADMFGPLALTARMTASRYLCVPSLKIELP